MVRPPEPGLDFAAILKAGSADGPDRVYGIVVASYIEDYLQRLLEADLPGLNSKLREKIFSNFGPLSTAAARIDMARARHLITAVVHGDAVLIARIRNRFAHNIHIDSFEHAEVKPLCDQLKFPKELVATVKEGTVPKSMLKQFPVETTRGAFSWSAVQVCGALNNTLAHIIAQRDQDQHATSTEKPS